MGTQGKTSMVNAAKWAIIITYLCLTTSFSNAAEIKWTPNRRQITLLEQSLEMKLPNKVPLSSYVRIYAGSVEGGRKKIEGSLVVAVPPPKSDKYLKEEFIKKIPQYWKTGTYIVQIENLYRPVIEITSSCSVIFLRYDVDKASFDIVGC